ncbi:hypothetical protein Tco_0789014 [Tanacetum coccineum]
MWTEICLAYEGPSDTRDTKIAALRLKFNAFKELEGEKVNGLIDDIYASKTKRFTIQASSLKALISNIHSQDNDSDVKEDKRISNEFMADLNVEYHERALLANQKRFYKRSRRVGQLGNTCTNLKRLVSPMGNLRIDELTKGKNDKGKGDKGKSDKGLIGESFDWDDESVSLEDEGTTKFKAFMEIVEDEPSLGKGDARSGQWVDITMKKVHRLLSMIDNDERKHVLDYTHVDLYYVED